MRFLLSKRDQRHLRFLELLMQNDSLTLEAASLLSGYPVRTLAADIGHINTYISPSQIRTSTSGLYLHIPTESSIRDVYSKLLRQSRECRLLVYLFYHRGKTQEEVADSQYVSISTMQRVIKAMNLALARRHISIRSRPANMEVAGDEAQIARLYIALFSEWYYDETGPMTAGERALLLELNRNMAAKGHIPLYYAEMKHATLWAYVHLVRYCQGYFRPRRAPGQRKPPAPVVVDRDFRARFEAAFGAAPDDELLFSLYANLQRLGAAHGHADLRAATAHSARLKQLDIAIRRLLEKVAAALCVSPADTDSLRWFLLDAIGTPDASPYALYNKYTVFVEAYKKNNAPAADIILGQIKEAFPTMASEDADKVAYCLITHWPGLMQKIERQVPDVRVGIFFDSDIEHAKMISDLIKVKSPIKTRVLVPIATSVDALAEWCRNIDVMITNIPFLRPAWPQTICIREYPGTRDWQAITQALEKAYSGKWRASAACGTPHKARQPGPPPPAVGRPASGITG